MDRYLYSPSFCQKIISFILLPLSFIYCLISTLKRKFGSKYTPKIPVISIGNLTVGGNGKTPFLISVAKRYKNVAVILRGYGRESRGTILVSKDGEILRDVNISGDEAALIARELKDALVIVSENRVEAVKMAESLGAKTIFLDDGFRHKIKKFDILLKGKVEPYFNFCLPSGAFRENPYAYKSADLRLKEGIDFFREVKIENRTNKMMLITAIANPKRLDEFLDNSVVEKHYFSDHHFFADGEIEAIFKKSEADSIVVTQKDMVKLKNLELPISLMKLDIKIEKNALEKIDCYIKNY